LSIIGYDNHDWRATFGTQLKELGLTSPQVADLMGHADTRMVERIYAPRRHEGIMKHKDSINLINQFI
jgi:integrase